MTARYERASSTVVAQLDDAEIIAALPAWRASCGANRRGATPGCDALGADAPDLRRALSACCDAWRIVAQERRADGTARSGCAIAAARDDDCGTVVAERRRGLMTGYYEPELDGSRTRDATHSVPLYGVPPDLLTIDLAAIYPELRGQRVRGRLVQTDSGARVVPYWSRAQIEHPAGDGAKLGGGELLWVDDPLAAFFLQVQGSGRVRLADGSIVRVGYAETNGQPYRSIGRWLVDQGELKLQDATVPGIEAWARAHPERVDELLDANPSYVFFREMPLGDPADGPRGALGVPLQAEHSVAVDPRFVPLGAPLVISRTDGTRPRARLAFGQDTGGAIRGPIRFDLFRGTGPAAGAAAGVQRDEVEAWILLPKGVAPPALLRTDPH
ncbi:MAG TPA: murein transglycosylase A [Burkholderiaceae bacterium]|nr:murein transglycosylase A [Burkholderiaceae bacterium]